MPRFYPVDIHVGTRMRHQRSLVGMSLSQFSEFVGLTIHQIHKYERGTNRISSSRLYEFAKVLNVPVSYFSMKCPSTHCRADRCRLAAAKVLAKPARRSRRTC